MSFILTEWSNEETLQFLEHYRAEDTIWDYTQGYHKDKTKVNDAWDRLSATFNRSVTELKKKKDSLMATFRGHVRRKRASLSSGASGDQVYKPVWFAYDLMESFLAPDLHCDTFNTVYIKTEPDPLDDAPVETVYDEVGDCASAHSEDTSQSALQLPSPHTAEQTYNYVPEHAASWHSPPLQEEECQIKQQYSVLKDVVDRVPPNGGTGDDECDLFGKMLAKKLRKLDEIPRQLLMHRIDGMVIDDLVDQMGHPNTTTTPDSNL